MVRCGRPEDNKGRGQEVERSEENTEISPCLKMTVTRNWFISHSFPWKRVMQGQSNPLQTHHNYFSV